MRRLVFAWVFLSLAVLLTAAHGKHLDDDELLLQVDSQTSTQKYHDLIGMVDEDGKPIYPWEVESFDFGFDDSPVDAQPGDPDINDLFDPELTAWLARQDAKDRELTPAQEERIRAQKKLEKFVRKLIGMKRRLARARARFIAARGEHEDLLAKSELPKFQGSKEIAKQLAKAKKKLTRAKALLDKWTTIVENSDQEARRLRDALRDLFRQTACRDFPCASPTHDCLLDPNGTFPFRLCGRACNNQGEDPRHCGRHQFCQVNIDPYGVGGGVCVPICKRDTCKNAGPGLTRCIVSNYQATCVNPCTHQSFDGDKVCKGMNLACVPSYELKDWNYRCVDLCNDTFCQGDVQESHCVMSDGQPKCVDPCETVCRNDETCIRRVVNRDGVEFVKFRCKSACPKFWFDNPCRDNPEKTRCFGINHEAVCKHPCFKNNCDPAFQRCVAHPTEIGHFQCEDL